MKIYDFAIDWPERLTNDDFFINALKAECKRRRLSFIFIGKGALKSYTEGVKKGNIRIKFYLDMASETFVPKDKFNRFAYCLKDSGTKVVADPDDVREAADKSITHFDLLTAKIRVPYTVVIRNWAPTKRLSFHERRRLGLPFVIKPALGYGQKGVKIINRRRPLKDMAQARRFDRGDNFLLQEFIQPAELGGLSAWFRVYHLFGEIIPCWWDPRTHANRQVTLREMHEYQLLPLVRIASEIAHLTHIEWFSCEIALSRKSRKFVTIDYMNDQCAIYPKSRHKDGMADDLIMHIAERMVDKAWYFIKSKPTLNFRALWFPRIKTRDEDA